MVIAHNLMAMNTARQLGINDKRKAKSTEKLSSGYKINRSADDAAGLAISEKLRRQIRGLDQGARNIQDGISLVQTADGALEEVVGMLQRVRELSIKSYNGTNSESDIEAMQEEVDQLLIEIERVGQTTTFNEKKIFQGVDEVDLYEDYVYVQPMEVSYYFGLPEWLDNESDDMMERHSSYNYPQPAQDGIMFQDDGVSKKYYGEYRGDSILDGYGNRYEWGGGIPVDPSNPNDPNLQAGVWSGNINDNPSAKLDFSGLFKNISSARDLYDNLTKLLGASVGYPCGTCPREMIGIFFGGESKQVMVESIDDVYQTLDLSDSFDAVERLLARGGVERRRP